MSRFAKLTFATTVAAIGSVAACNDDMGSAVAFYGTSCGGTDCEFDSGGNFGFDANTSYEDASFSGDSSIDAAIDAPTDDADASDAGEDAD